MKLAERLTSLRKSRDLSASQLCRMAGISRLASYYDWEAGRTLPALIHLWRLAGVYEMSVSEILLPVAAELDAAPVQTVSSLRAAS